MNGEGSTFPRTVTRPDGTTYTRYVAQLSIGPRGHRRQLSRVCRTKAEARAALRELIDAQRARRNPSKLSLGAYLRWWLDETARPSISANTYRGYEDVLGHLEPIADIALEALRAEDIEHVCNRMTAQKGRKVTKASPKTVRNAQVMLRRALGQAEARGHVARNVAKLVPLRRVPRRSKDALTPELARRILAAVKGDRYEAAFALAMVGLRASEILGLGWSDVRLEEPASVEVRYQIVGSGKRAARAELKTAASAAPVPLPAFVVERITAHKAAQRAERPIVDLEGSLVFVTDAGFAVSGSWLTKHFQALLAAAGLPRMTIHDLRHGAATLLVAAGAHPRVAQELLRHASSRTTMDIYSHVTAAQQREAVELLQRAMVE